jgi:hypothetical protein
MGIATAYKQIHKWWLSPFNIVSYKRTFLSLRAFATTDTELKLIAAAAIIGLSRIPKKG